MKAYATRTMMVCVALAAWATTAPAQGTAHTYQGHLKIDGAAPSEPIEMIFSLWDHEDSTDPANLIAVMDPVAVTVSQGLFMSPLDFGNTAFNDLPDSPRWLQIEILPPGETEYLSLPRQAIWAAPFSMATRGVKVDSLGNIGIGAEPGPGPLFGQTRLHIDGAGDAEVDNGSGLIVAGPADGSNVAIDNNEVLSRNNGGPAGLYINRGGGDVLIAHDTDSGVGIGTNNPSEKLEVLGNILVSNGNIRLDHNGPAIRFERDDFEIWEIYQTSTGDDGLGFFNLTDGAYRFYLGASGNVGIGTTSPTAKLEVVGTVRQPR